VNQFDEQVMLSPTVARGRSLNCFASVLGHGRGSGDTNPDRDRKLSSLVFGADAEELERLRALTQAGDHEEPLRTLRELAEAGLAGREVVEVVARSLQQIVEVEYGPAFMVLIRDLGWGHRKLMPHWTYRYGNLWQPVKVKPSAQMFGNGLYQNLRELDASEFPVFADFQPWLQEQVLDVAADILGLYTMFAPRRTMERLLSAESFTKLAPLLSKKRKRPLPPKSLSVRALAGVAGDNWPRIWRNAFTHTGFVKEISASDMFAIESLRELFTPRIPEIAALIKRW
jgi:hypothetical protein